MSNRGTIPSPGRFAGHVIEPTPGGEASDAGDDQQKRRGWWRRLIE